MIIKQDKIENKFYVAQKRGRTGKWTDIIQGYSKNETFKQAERWGKDHPGVKTRVVLETRTLYTKITSTKKEVRRG